MGHTRARLLIRAGLLSRVNIVEEVTVNGTVTRNPIMAGRRYENLAENERWMVDVLRILFQGRTGAFVDVGVSVGQTLVKAKSVDGAVRYFRFEPNPACVY